MYWKADAKEITDSGDVFDVYEYFSFIDTPHGETFGIAKWTGNNIEEFLTYYEKNKKL